LSEHWLLLDTGNTHTAAGVFTLLGLFRYGQLNDK
jgi:hypothetical protein